MPLVSKWSSHNVDDEKATNNEFLALKHGDVGGTVVASAQL